MKNFNTNQKLTEFKIGNEVSIINSFTGEISYTGIIINLSKKVQFNQEYKRFERPAVIKTNNGLKCNYLGTAILVK